MEPGWTGIHPAARAGKYRIKRTRHGHDQLRCTESWQWGRKSWGENAAWFGRRRSGFCILWNSKYILWQRYYQTGMCAGCSEYSDCVLCIRWHLQSDGNGINRSLFQRNVKKSRFCTLELSGGDRLWFCPGWDSGFYKRWQWSVRDSR